MRSRGKSGITDGTQVGTIQGRGGNTGMDANLKGLLAIPSSFRATALALPDKIDQALAVISTPAAAKEMLDKADAMAHFARRIKADTEISNAINYGKLKIVAKLGELLPAKPPAERGQGRSGGKSVQAASIDLSPQTLVAYRKVAAAKDRLDSYYQSNAVPDEDDGKKAGVSLAGFLKYINVHVTNNSGEVEWYTPPEYIEAAREVMGSIDLDPATSRIAQKMVKAKRFYTAEDDGLSQEWHGNVWMNPPYAATLIRAFMNKLCDELAAKRVTQAVVLTNNATDTEWWQMIAAKTAAMCTVARRVRFLNESLEPANSPLQGQTVLYVGKRHDQFRECFGGFGMIWNGGSDV